MSPPDERRGPPVEGPDQASRRQAHRTRDHTPPVAGPEVWPSTPACPCWQCRVERAADQALADGDLVALDDIVLAPDVVVAEMAANGHEIPDTWRLQRADGRTVSVYARPEAGR